MLWLVLIFKLHGRQVYFKIYHCKIEAPKKSFIHPPASEASKGGSKFNWKKIHINPYMVSKNLSVSLSVCYKLRPQLSWDWPNRTGWNFFRTSKAKTHISKYFSLKQVSKHRVLKAVKKIKNKKSAGVEGVAQDILVMWASTIAQSLTIIPTNPYKSHT